MTVTPTGIISRPLAALRSALAACPAFQDWVEAADETEAAGSIYIISAPDSASMPFAVIDCGEFRRERDRVTDNRPFQTRGPSATLLYFRAEVTEGDDTDAAYEFCNPLGDVLEELEKFAGDRANGFPAIVQLEQFAPPTRTGTEERATIGDQYEATFAITWSRQP